MKKNELVHSVSESVILEAIATTETAIENARECLVHHDDTVGRTTKKNKALAAMYEREISQAEAMLQLLEGLL